MASELVDGLLLPVRVGGHPTLDFCNTRAAWPADVPKEYLTDHAHLALWSREAGLLSRAQAERSRRAGRRDPGAADEVRVRAVRFRTALYDVLVGHPATGRPPAGPRSTAWELVAAECGWAAGHAVLDQRRGPDGVGRWVLPTTTDPVLLPYLAVVRSAAELLTSPDGSTVDACPMPDCGWVFTNPTGRRRWCRMAWCGNRSKVRRHAARLRERS